jgi:hypothetical protein
LEVRIGSGGGEEREEAIEGVLRLGLRFRFEGWMVDPSECSRSMLGAVVSAARLVEERLEGVGGRWERGRGQSSSE